MFGKDSKEVATREAETADPFMQMLERVAANKDIDANKVEKLVDLQMKIMDRDEKAAFYTAMNVVQGTIERVLPDRTNDQTNSRYATIEAIAAAIKPVYTAEGFSVSFWQGEAKTEGYIGIAGTLRHKGGHSEPYSLELPPDKVGIRGSVNKTDVHAAASTFKYGRRILTCMMFDVAVGEDNDGNQEIETISPDQVNDLCALVNEVGADLDGLLKWQGVKTCEDISASDYPDVIKELESRR